jgi:hypothetical protein
MATHGGRVRVQHFSCQPPVTTVKQLMKVLSRKVLASLWLRPRNDTSQHDPRDLGCSIRADDAPRQVFLQKPEVKPANIPKPAA